MTQCPRLLLHSSDPALPGQFFLWGGCPCAPWGVFWGECWALFVLALGTEPRAWQVQGCGNGAALGVHQPNSANHALHLKAETIFKITLNWVVDAAKAPSELQTKLSHLLLAEILQM